MPPQERNSCLMFVTLEGIRQLLISYTIHLQLENAALSEVMGRLHSAPGDASERR